MAEVSTDKNIILSRLSKIVEDLMGGNSLFQSKLDKATIIELLFGLFEKFSPEEMKAIAD